MDTGCCSGSAARGLTCTQRSVPSVAFHLLARGDAMGLLRLAVLGPPEVVHDGTRLTFALRKAQALLLYLAVEGGMHSRSKLAAFLWPDSAPHDARTACATPLPCYARCSPSLKPLLPRTTIYA